MIRYQPDGVNSEAALLKINQVWMSRVTQLWDFSLKLFFILSENRKFQLSWAERTHTAAHQTSCEEKLQAPGHYDL